jgi:hypothetical protein
MPMMPASLLNCFRGHETGTDCPTAFVSGKPVSRRWTPTRPLQSD